MLKCRQNSPEDNNFNENLKSHLLDVELCTKYYFKCQLRSWRVGLIVEICFNFFSVMTGGAGISRLDQDVFCNGWEVHQGKEL